MSNSMDIKEDINDDVKGDEPLLEPPNFDPNDKAGCIETFIYVFQLNF